MAAVALSLIAGPAGSAAATATPAAATATPAPVEASAATLGAAAAGSGRYFGTSVMASKLADPAYTGILDREFSSFSPENETKWDGIESRENAFNFSNADLIVNRAKAHGSRVRGGYLVWHSGLPGWVGVSSSPARLGAIVNNHVTKVMAHFKGKIHTWDVVAEAFDDSGTGARRRSIFQYSLGDRWVEDAFVAARAADPGASLCYSDYLIENFESAKTQAVYRMVKDFKARGIPIDCLGLQSHFGRSNPIPATFQRTIQEFTRLGLDVHISELDIEGSGQTQADDYRKVVGACLSVARCLGITVWGVRDSDSWRSMNTPVLFDTKGEKKPAYHAVLSALLDPASIPVTREVGQPRA